MSIITLDLEDRIADTLARAAEASKKPLSVWVLERLNAAASEDIALANGYPRGYWKLFSSMEENLDFEAPVREPLRAIATLNET